MKRAEDVLYTRIAKQAFQNLQGQTSSVLAWQNSAAQLASSPHSRDKGCPRSAFVGLANGGYLRGVSGRAEQLSKNATYALVAKELYDERPEYLEQRAAWWAAVSQRCGTQRSSQNGVLDVVAGLIQVGAFRK